MYGVLDIYVLEEEEERARGAYLLLSTVPGCPRTRKWI